MPDIGWNLQVWNDDPSVWGEGGENWSSVYGGSEAQWFGSLFPRLHHLFPAKNILEIAPGFGRWTRFLLPLCERYTGIDLSPVCVEHCRTAFANAQHARFLRNDGVSLGEVPDGTIDFVFSFDSLVHVGPGVFQSYIPQILRKLNADGTAFLHHSNLGYFADPGSIDSGSRDPLVSADSISQLVRLNGGQILVQELINWVDTAQLRDCLTVFDRRSRFGRTVRLLNPRFMDEAKLICDYQARYARLAQRTDTTSPPPGTENLALGRPARQSSLSPWSRRDSIEADAAGGNNGEITGGYGFHTDIEDDPWWQVDLGTVCSLAEIRVYNRLDLHCAVRANRLEMLTSKDGESWDSIYRHDGSEIGGLGGDPLIFHPELTVHARFLMIRLPGTTCLHLDEIEVYGSR